MYYQREVIKYAAFMIHHQKYFHTIILTTGYLCFDSLRFLTSVILLMACFDVNHVQSLRLWASNDFYRNLDANDYRYQDLRPSFNSWGGWTSGIAYFVTAPQLVTPQGYYVPNTMIKEISYKKKTPLLTILRKGKT